jgi:hypothetical protein
MFWFCFIYIPELKTGAEKEPLHLRFSLCCARTIALPIKVGSSLACSEASASLEEDREVGACGQTSTANPSESTSGA